MPDSTAQVVIIGASIMGASIAYHLAARLHRCADFGAGRD
jgi:glycine/D-amino acid oxidase-like deaminating enzyme